VWCLRARRRRATFSRLWPAGIVVLERKANPGRPPAGVVFVCCPVRGRPAGVPFVPIGDAGCTCPVHHLDPSSVRLDMVTVMCSPYPRRPATMPQRPSSKLSRVLLRITTTVQHVPRPRHHQASSSRQEIYCSYFLSGMHAYVRLRILFKLVELAAVVDVVP
jgi:hypothetical protein